MASSGTFLFNPTLAEIVDEVFERCGMDSAGLSMRHILSVRRSMNIMFADWSNIGPHQWAIDQQTVNPTPGTTNYAMPAGTVDVFDMILRRQGVDTQMYCISRDDYLLLHNKLQPGRYDRYFVDRQISPVFYVWPVGDIPNDQIIYNRLRQIQDAGAASNTADIPYRWYDAFATDLSWRVAMKFAADRAVALKAEAWAGDQPVGALKRALMEDRERAPLRTSVRYGRRR